MLEHVCQLARNAGDAIMQVYDGIKPIEITSKQDDSPVTAADIAAHKVILEGLLALTPDIPVLSEEAPRLGCPPALAALLAGGPAGRDQRVH